MTKRKPYVPDPEMGRVIFMGFPYSSSGRKAEIFRVEVEMRDMTWKERKKFIDNIQKIQMQTGAKP